MEEVEKIIDDEIIAEGIVKVKDPNYLYFLDSNGNLRKRRKGNYKRNLNRRKNKRTRVFSDLNLTVPKILLSSYMSQKEKKVIKYGNSGAMISMPNWMIGMKGKLIFIPIESMNDVKENVINLF